MLKETIMNFGGTIARKAEEHSPEICLGVGVVSMVAATVFACKGTIKAREAVDTAKDDFAIIDATEENGVTYDDDNNEIPYSHDDSIKDKSVVAARTVVELAKDYGPAIVLTIVGIGFLFKGHDILKKRNVELLVAYEGISEAYRKYQDKVKEFLGETAAKDIKYGLKEHETEVDTGKKSKDGTPKTKKEKKIIIDGKAVTDFSPYARFFDSSCKGWENDPAYNLTYLTCKQNWCNDRLRIEGVLTLNDVYGELGIPKTKQGQVVGWSLKSGKGDGYVDFGIFNSAYTPNRDFVNGYEPVILLDFNVDDRPILNDFPDGDEL